MDDSYLTILYGAFGLYVVLLLVAVAFDTWKFVIPNAVTLALVGLFVATMLLLPFDTTWRDWLSHVGAGVAVFAVGAALYAFNKLGGGDVKLLAAVSLWAGFDHLIELLLFVCIAGGALAIFLIVARRLILGLRTASTTLGEVNMPRVLLVGEAVPYALAIAPPAIYFGAQWPHLGGFLSI